MSFLLKKDEAHESETETSMAQSPSHTIDKKPMEVNGTIVLVKKSLHFPKQCATATPIAGCSNINNMQEQELQQQQQQQQSPPQCKLATDATPERIELLLKNVELCDGDDDGQQSTADTGGCHHNANERRTGILEVRELFNGDEQLPLPKYNCSDREDEHEDDSNDEVFRLSCGCARCLRYRESVIQVLMEEYEYNTLWERLQIIFGRLYIELLGNEASVISCKYKSLMTKSATKWVSDGHLDSRLYLQGYNVPLTNRLTSMVAFSRLYARDPHQLFELVCIQLKAITMSYNEGILGILQQNSKEPRDPHTNKLTFSGFELLTFLLDGYDKMLAVTEHLKAPLFEALRLYLLQFSLNWAILHKQIYQRWVYLDVQDFIPDVILQLKEQLPCEDYKAIVGRFIDFERSMTATKSAWKSIWAQLHKLHLSKEDRARRHRILFIHTLLATINSSRLPSTIENEYRPLPEWPSVKNREDVWRCAVHYMRNKWVECSSLRVEASVTNVQCVKCKYEFPTHFADCVCPSCLIAGGVCETKRDNSCEQSCCVRCSYFDALKQRDCRLKGSGGFTIEGSQISPVDVAGYLELRRQLFEENELIDELDADDEEDDEDDDDEDEEESQNINDGGSYANGSYHLAWALFHHLPTRVPYIMQKFNPKHLCTLHHNPPCRRYECRVAFHILSGIYPPNFSKYLCRYYQPLNDGERKELRKMKHMALTSIIKKASETNMWNIDKRETSRLTSFGAIDLLWTSDDTDYTLLGDMGSAFAECYLKEEEFSTDDSHTRFFMVDGKDIYLNEETFSAYLLDFKTQRTSSPPPKKKNGMKEGNVLADKLNLLRIVFEENEADTTCLKEAKKKIAAAAEVASAIEAKYPHKISLLSGPIPSTSSGILSSCSKSDKSENQIKSDALSEAIKLAVNQKINQNPLSRKLEAELKSLKMEHSVLKDMVRDLEHIKEKEEKQPVRRSQLQPAVHNQCCSEHADFVENHPTKMCHRGDGQCACYYCTIFGHTECNHGRTNETRDRLRKRLHQIHSKIPSKTLNMKNAKTPSGMYKKLPTTSTAPPPIPKEMMSLNVAAIPKSVNLQLQYRPPKTAGVRPFKNRSQAPTLVSPPNPITEHIINSKMNINNTPINATIKSPTNTVPTIAVPCTHESNVNERIDVAPEKPRPKSPQPSTSAAAQAAQAAHIATPPTPPFRRDSSSTCSIEMGTAPIQDILEYIEGGGSNKTKDAAKKAAKKAKQKQKKEDVKQIEELTQLRDEFHEVYFSEVDKKNELQSLKSVKKKDKKKIGDVEIGLKKINRNRSKLETQILEMIDELKDRHPDLKFDYIPTKEQINQRKIAAATKQASATEQQPLQKTKKAETSDGSNVTATKSSQNVQQDCEITLDPPMCMVTIRRVNLPNSNPQVTITTKSASPDKDQLLYTFVNGQLVVPPSAISPQAAPQINQQILSQATVAQYQKQHQELRQQNAALATSAASASNQNTGKGQADTKKNKKEKTPPQVVETPVEVAVQPQKNIFPTKKELKQQKAVKAAAAAAAKQASVEPAIETAIVSAKKKVKGKSEVSGKGKQPEQTKVPKEVIIEEPLAVIKKSNPMKQKKTKYEYVDPQYKMNKFDVLDMEDDDDSDEESIISEPVEIEPEVIPKKKDNKMGKMENLKQKKPDDQTKIKPVNKPMDGSAKTTPPQSVNLESDMQLTKKQRKKLARKNIDDAVESTNGDTYKVVSHPTKLSTKIKKTIQKAESMAKALKNPTQRLHLNSDTTIELVNDERNQVVDDQSGSAISIMEQLNRGVKVEGLTLPPGITLTRVDPNSVEAVRAKKESIGRLSQPMKPQTTPAHLEHPQPPPHMIMANPLSMSSGMMSNMGVTQDANGMILVDAMNMSKKQPQLPPTPSNDNGSKKSRRNRKKKNKQDPTGSTLKHPAGDASKSRNSNNGKNETKPQMVTLRNPMMFRPMNDAMRQQPMQFPPSRPAQPQIPSDQPAAIIKNENGMFTIRNPALHQALSNGVGNNFRQYSQGQAFMSSPTPEPVPESFSYFSDGASNVSSQSPKCNSVIGSEVRSAQMAWQSNLAPANKAPAHTQMNGDLFGHGFGAPSRSYSPFDGVPTKYGFNNDIFGNAATSNTLPNVSGASGGFFNTDSYTPYSQGGNENNSFFSHPNPVINPNHTPPLDTSRLGGMQYDYAGVNGKYTDIGFLQNLQVGQRLNSEVTIHNISESKFGQNVADHPEAANGVEITRISRSPHPLSDQSINMALGTNNRMQTNMMGHFPSDNIFAQNFMKLGEMETEGPTSLFDFNCKTMPQNLPKMNLSAQATMLGNKMQQHIDTTSPGISSFSGRAASLADPNAVYEIDKGISALHLSSPNGSNVPPPYSSDSNCFVHGVIGEKLKSHIG